MQYVMTATATRLPKERATVYWHGHAVSWHWDRNGAKRYAASDAAMMKIAMSDCPHKFNGAHLVDFNAIEVQS